MLSLLNRILFVRAEAPPHLGGLMLYFSRQRVPYWARADPKSFHTGYARIRVSRELASAIEAVENEVVRCHVVDNGAYLMEKNNEDGDDVFRFARVDLTGKTAKEVAEIAGMFTLVNS